jgi:hypothetical protein
VDERIIRSRSKDALLWTRDPFVEKASSPEYGDTVPSLIMGAAGMTYEKGRTVKDKLPQSMVDYLTSTDVANGVLVSGHYTALVNTTSSTIATGTGTPPLQTFVNSGGIYVGGSSGAQATTSARNAMVTNLTTSTISGLSTPGSTFDGRFDIGTGRLDGRPAIVDQPFGGGHALMMGSTRTSGPGRSRTSGRSSTRSSTR